MSKQIKRPRENLTSTSATASLAGKRVKFASEDAAGGSGAASRNTAGGEDDFEQDLEEGGGPSSKKGVMTDGYDSDSSAGSDGGFGVGGGRKGKKDVDGGMEEDDDDMFGGGDDDGKKSKGKGGKGKAYLEMGDIEGQEFGRGDEEEDEEVDEEDYLEEDDLANDDDAPRTSRNKATMGYKLSSFNMAEELQEGRFGADGSYVQNASDTLAKHDSWLDGLSKQAIKAARDSKKRMDEQSKQRESETKGEGALAQERDDCLIGILNIVREGETVARALARLGGNKKRVVRVRKTKPAPTPEADPEAMELDDDNSTPTISITHPSSTPSPSDLDPATQRINLLTHLASTLLAAHGEIEIYDQTYEDILKTLKSEGAVRRDWKPPTDPSIAEEEATRKQEEDESNQAALPSNRIRTLIARPTVVRPPSTPGLKFLYKWVTPPAGQPVQEYGPYSYDDMQGWIAGGYFGAEGAGVSVKVQGKDTWSTWREASST